MLYAGHEQCAPGHRWDGIRDHVLLHIVDRGWGVVWSGRSTRVVGPGDYFLFLPHARARYQSSEEEPWRYSWVGFACDRSDELQVLTGISAERRAAIGKADEASIGHMHDLIAALHQRDARTAVRINGLLLLALAGLKPDQPAPRRRSNARVYVEAALEFIHRNFQRPLTVRAIALHIGVDRAHLTRCFQAELGRSPREYLIAHRMQRARHLLESTGLPVSAVAASVGYDCYASFERRYRSVAGEPPGQTRRAVALTSRRPGNALR